jgi:DNA-binding MarR family transcriptional regulator
MFTLYDLSRLLRIKYHKALKIVNFLMTENLVEKVDHGGDRRKRRYRII